MILCIKRKEIVYMEQEIEINPDFDIPHYIYSKKLWNI